MRILYISSPFFADCDFPLIKEYQSKGLDVKYLILLPPYALRSTLIDIKEQISRTDIFLSTAYEEFKKYDSYLDLNNVYIANRTGYNALSFSYWKHLYDLYQFIKKGDFDIIHCDILNVPRIKTLHKLAKQWIQTIHDPFPHSGEATSKKSKAYKRILSYANNIVLLNKKQKDEFCSAYNINPDKVYINSLGIYDNIKFFVDPKTKIQKNNVLFFGRISPYKGIEYLCEAMKIVRKEIPDATLTIAGGGKLYFDIEPYEKLGYINVKNYYIGMEELAELVAACELCVCPYTDATQSGVIMTSYSLGKPVIATNVGGLPEMVENGKTGLIVPAKDSDKLARAIIELLKDKERLQSMSNYINQEYVNGTRSWSDIALKYCDLYSSVLGEN